MHLPTSSATTPAITAITTVTTTVTAVVTTTATTAAECPLPYKDYPGSLWTLFLGIVGRVIATYIADGHAAKAAMLCWIFISAVWEILQMKVAWKIGALKKKWERKRRDRQGWRVGVQPQPEEGSGA